MGRIREKELILPALFLMSKEEEQKINTSTLIKRLEELIEVDEEDKGIIKNRKDTFFSQKVRNLKSHNTLVNKGFAAYNDGFYKLTEIGEKYLDENLEQLKLIINEEKLIYQNTIIVKDYFEEYKKSIENIRKLNEVKSLGDEELNVQFHNMLFSSVITIIETFLSDALKANLQKEDYLKRFVKTFKDFNEIKFSLNDVFDKYEDIEDIVIDKLSSIMYHNLPKLKGIYKDTFDIDFIDITELMKSITVRHDIVHRNGKKKDGTKHEITISDIYKLCDESDKLITNIQTGF